MNSLSNIIIIIKTYLLAIIVFFTFRFILFLSFIGSDSLSDVALMTVIQSFIMGVRFDIVISGYILFIPALLLIILGFFNGNHFVVKRVVFYWIFIFFTIAFGIAAADIPYFKQFNSRFSIGAFDWMDNADFVFSMIIQEKQYFLVFIPFLILTILFFLGLKRVFRSKCQIILPNHFLGIVVSLLFLSIMFLGIRGRIEKKSPIRIGTAYFSDNSFLNKLGLNPVFTLIQSYLDAEDGSHGIINIMTKETAIENIKKYLVVEDQGFGSPIARRVIFSEQRIEKPNVVVIIMESMSAAKMSRHGNSLNLTPFLDSLSKESLYFNNIYTAGKHTFNGVFSTLFSFPAIYRQHPLKEIQKYHGISSVLLNHGYSTTYFTTHDSQFDNVEGFLRENDFQNIISQADYPTSEVKTTLGVPDDYLFRFSIDKLDEMSQTGKPFFATFMTASDHGPFYIPEYFSPKSAEIRDQIVEYADWSLNKFITLAKKKSWFDNTIFVFVADHGAAIDAKYDIALNYHHSPLIFFCPSIINEPKEYDMIGGQIDIFPTIMGILKLNYINNTLGIDLLNESKPYTIINDDNKYGVLDTKHLLIVKEGERHKLYDYSTKNLSDLSFSFEDKAIDMDIYAKTNLQVFQNLIIENKTAIINDK